MDLHVETLLLVYQVVAALMAAVTIGGAWQARGRFGLWFWAAAFATAVVTQLLRVPVAALWGPQASLPVGHAGSIVLASMFLLGVRAFLGLPLHVRRVALAGTAGLAVIAAGFTLGGAGLSLALSQLASAALLLAGLLPLRRAWRRTRSFPLALAVLTFAATTLAHVARGISVLPGVAASSSQATALNAFWILAYIVLLILMAFSNLLLINAALQRELAALADFDPLTGLCNRGGLDSRVHAMARRAALSGRPQTLSVALVDLDHFKQINDIHGHAVGDDVLRELGERLRAQLRPGDLAVRLGGEEFAVLWLDAAAPRAVRLAERLRDWIGAQPFPTRAGPIPATASVGVATGQGWPDGLAPLLQAADAALYRAKREGRNRVVPAG